MINSSMPRGWCLRHLLGRMGFGENFCVKGEVGGGTSSGLFSWEEPQGVLLNFVSQLVSRLCCFTSPPRCHTSQ